MSGAGMPALRVIAIVPVDDTESSDAMAAVSVAASLATARGADAEAVLLGRAISEQAVSSAVAEGARRIMALEHPGFATPPSVPELLEVLAPHLRDLGNAIILTHYGAAGEELAARAAARIGGQALGRCATLEIGAGEVTATKAVVGGRVTARLTASRWPIFASVRRIAGTSASTIPEQEAVVERMTSDASLPAADHVLRVPASADRHAKVVGAKLVVGGGRGLGGPEGFGVLKELAESLGGAFGGSLPTVDAGWVPVAQQIGQSGHYVTAELYLAVGVSGTAQHLAGISPATKIVAINNDPEADIFRVADVAVVGDWKAILPQLIERLREG